MEHAQLLKFEPAMIYLQLDNRLGSGTVIGPKPGQVRVAVEVDLASGGRATRTRPEPILSLLALEGGESRTLRFDLSRWYDLSTPGRYLARATAEWKAERFVSRGVSFDVVSGMALARVRKYLPGYDDVERVYTVRYLARRGSEEAFLCVDEVPSGLNYGVFRLGQIIRLFRPTVEIDSRGRVTVTHQSRPYCYTRSVFLSSRHRVYRVDQTYHLPDGRPYPLAVTAPDAVDTIPRIPGAP